MNFCVFNQYILRPLLFTLPFIFLLFFFSKGYIMSVNNKSVSSNKRKNPPSDKDSALNVSSTISSTSSINKRRALEASDKKTNNGKASICSVGSTTSSNDSSSVYTGSYASWLPPISSLMLPTLGTSSSSPPPPPLYNLKEYYPEQLHFHQPLYSYIPQFKEVPKPKTMNLKTMNLKTMPIIPYFFHHKQFGIETCMLQLEEQRAQQMQRYHYYAAKIGNHGHSHYL